MGRGTYVLDARDLWEDVLIAFKNDPSSRKEKLVTNLRVFLDAIKKKYAGRKEIKVSFTGHSLGGTVCAQVYNELRKINIKTEEYKGMLGNSYAYNPGVSPIPSTDGTKLWTHQILLDKRQHIIVTEGDLVAMSLILLTKKPRARLHVITGLDFRSAIMDPTRAKQWFSDMKKGTGNILPNKIQVHELPAFFTLCRREDALTRPQVNRYLDIEEFVSGLPSFKKLSVSAQRILLCKLTEKFNVETDWKEQCLEVKHVR